MRPKGLSDYKVSVGAFILAQEMAPKKLSSVSFLNASRFTVIYICKAEIGNDARISVSKVMCFRAQLNRCGLKWHTTL